MRTVHAISDRGSCRFVDVHHGQEVSSGNSWKVTSLYVLNLLRLLTHYKNEQEVQVAVHLARSHHQKGETFKIITPYDAQRNALEGALKSSGLPWEDKCFNVDSFQGEHFTHASYGRLRHAS